MSNFFRDRESFDALAALIPPLFAGKSPSDSVRVWCPGCATGEEAYSLAILLLEYARTLDVSPAVQVFGCDLDEDAIQTARAGVYPETIAADVPEDRLRRFFVNEQGVYRVRREIREAVLFASHDLLEDVPFSRIDLLSCRNLLIYLDPGAQSRALNIFHFALQAEGILFLGSSESVDEGSGQFAVLDQKHRIFRRLPGDRSNIPIPFRIDPHAPLAGADSWTGLHLKLLERLGPPSVVVDYDHQVRHVSETAGRFLHIGSGEPSANLLRMVKPELRMDLRALLFRAARSGEPAVAPHLPVRLDGQDVHVTVEVMPISEFDGGPAWLLILFRLQSPELAPAKLERSSTFDEPVVQHLERELDQMKTHLRSTVEQYEASTEELKASNEELQAMNEELRSATEELETSREELQSINEQMTAVNLELKSKVEELGRANSDLQNLMSATAIATVFLDRELKVMRFTQSAAPIFNLIASDIGRPLLHLRPRIRYGNLAADAERVLTSLSTVEREVQGAGDACYLARILPYRTVEDRIAGIVLTFVDISERQRAAAALLAQNEQLELFNQATIGRELRMVELKIEINSLLERLGEPPRYSTVPNEEAT